MSCDSRRMTVAEFIAAVSDEAAKHPFIHEVVLLDHTDYAAKLHLIIRSDLFIQLYANVRLGTRGYTVVHRGQRTYGRDCDAQGWHRHPAANPESHDVSEEGRRAVEIAEFLLEVADILEEHELL